MRRDGIRALLALSGPDGTAGPEADAVRAALEGCGVVVTEVLPGHTTDQTTAQWTDQTVAALETAYGNEAADLVLVSGAALLTAAAASTQLSGRLWVLATELPAPVSMVAAAPAHIEAVAPSARWVLVPDERSRGLLDAAAPAVAKRSAVLPVHGAPEQLATALGRLLERSFPDHAPISVRERPLRLVVAGHALHFLEAMLEDWRSDPGIELRVDHVKNFARHDEAVSRELAQWADTVVCEWASPVAAFYSRAKRPGQRLVVRLHRAELYSEWWKGIEIAAVDQVVTVSPHYARLTRETTGWPAEKVVTIPNYVDATVLARPKLPGAEFALGFMGAVPRRKRLDLALDVLELLRREDPRFTLFVKTKHAWELPYVWREDEERAAYEAALHRVRSRPGLVGGVVFDAYGSDVGAWLRRIGWMLSTSDDESFHLAPAETMASGGVPVIREWPGSDTIYDQEWLVPDAPAMAARIRDAVESGTWGGLAARAQTQALASFDTSVVLDRFARVLVEDLPPA